MTPDQSDWLGCKQKQPDPFGVNGSAGFSFLHCFPIMTVDHTRVPRTCMEERITSVSIALANRLPSLLA